MPIIRKAKKVDVLLVCEGTFPYIKGGVSSWIYQLIKDLPDFSFGIIFLGGTPQQYKEIAWELPENLIHLETHFLFDNSVSNCKVKYLEGHKDLIETMRKLHYFFRSHNDNIPDELKKLSFYKKIDHNQFLYSEKSFSFIVSEYEKNCPQVPFIDYFWTIRNIHSPVWLVAQVAMQALEFSIVHSPSTGYAGMLGAFLKNNYGKKFILTEHGIYLRERKIDIAISSWIEEYRLNLMKAPQEKNHLKEIWIRFFHGINKFAYESADEIISLYEGARKIQIQLSAKPEKTKVIPNGINISKFENALKNRPKEIPKVVALIGRVVPIKDVKTFITAIKIASESLKDIEGWIIGPTQEDKEYYLECLWLVKTLNLEEKIKFKGFQKLEEIFNKIGCLTLTSISEGMPLVVIEGFAAGVPAVTTNVGSCYELIYGKDEEDIKLGKAGEIIPTSNPLAAAKAYVSILTNANLWQQYSQNALNRVRKFYEEQKMLKKYKEIYLEAVKMEKN